tara:strand:- start:4894 stop:5451 length:558 start_codon:yes stop_codon:yes gene_type:complete
MNTNNWSKTGLNMSEQEQMPYLTRCYGLDKIRDCLFQILNWEKNGINLNTTPILKQEYWKNKSTSRLIYKYPNELFEYVNVLAYFNNNKSMDQLDLVGVQDCEYYHLTVVNQDFENPIINKIDDKTLKFVEDNMVNFIDKVPGFDDLECIANGRVSDYSFSSSDNINSDSKDNDCFVYDNEEKHK